MAMRMHAAIMIERLEVTIRLVSLNVVFILFDILMEDFRSFKFTCYG